MTTSYAVIGSGFRAFCNCMHLSQAGAQEIYMIDPAKSFGGVMNSRKVGDFFVDNGVHMFDSVPIELAEIVNEIMQKDVLDIDFVSESAFGGKITEGFSLPDLNSLPDKEKNTIRSEILNFMNDEIVEEDIHSVADYFLTRYGLTAGEIFKGIFKRLYGIDADEIHKSAITTTSLARLKFLDDDEMLDLKSKSPRLDLTLAARRKSQGKLDDFVSIYPKSSSGMRGWCEKAKVWLKTKKNVHFLLENKLENIECIDNKLNLTLSNNKIVVDKVVWANDNYSDLSEIFNLTSRPNDYFHHVPMVFVTLITDKNHIKNFTYIQNFNSDGLCNRFAASGIYSNQLSAEGLSFITAECPTTVGGKTWENYESLHEKVWLEAKSLKVVSESAELKGFDTVRVPKTVKMKKLGFDEAYTKFKQELRTITKNIVIPENVPFFRREIFLQSKVMCGDLSG